MVVNTQNKEDCFAIEQFNIDVTCLEQENKV